MNRTVALLGLAGGLVLLALVLGVPRPTGTPTGNSSAAPGPRLPLAVPGVSRPPPAEAPGALQMKGRLSHPTIGLGDQDVFLTVDLTAPELPGVERAPVNLALVIDRSGSMSGEKLAQAKKAARHLVTQLREQDRLALVHYGSDVRFLPGMFATESNKARMHRYIDAIRDDGGTNIAAGLRAGHVQLGSHRAAFKVNRLILISDGEPTEGIVEPSALLKVARNIRSEGVTLSAIGVGVDFNEGIMQGLAEYGAGAYAYLEDASRLSTIFQRDLQQAGTTVARDVGLSFELPDGVKLQDVLGYRHDVDGATVRIALSDFAAGQSERVIVRLSVRGERVGQTVDVARLQLRYSDLVRNAPAGGLSQLSAHVTDVREAITAAQDKEVVVIAARAQAAKNMDDAARRMSMGDRAGAARVLEKNEAIFREAEEVAGPAPVAAFRTASEGQANGLLGASAEELPAQVKAARRDARIDIGRMGSTY